MEQIIRKCSFCDGGKVLGSSQEPRTCEKCNGTGVETLGEINLDAIMDDLDKCKKRLKKIMDKLEISD